MSADFKKRMPSEDRQHAVQATLFRGIASKSEKEKLGTKSLKIAGPRPTVATKTQSTLSFAKQPSTVSEPATLVLWKQCASKDTPLAELKNRALVAMKSIFGVEKLRLLQPKAVSCALKRKSQLVVMATGGGTYPNPQTPPYFLRHIQSLML